MNMSKLPTFKINDVKQFKFSIEQYINLEIEYIRYIIYKELVKQIESLFKLSDGTIEHNRKLYENKNIIERFILECINHGLSPHIHTLQSQQLNTTVSKNTNESISDKSMEQIDIELMKEYLFFNKCLESGEILRNTVYYRKMISEYVEKKIRITPERLVAFEKLFLEAEHKFKCQLTNLKQNRTRPIYFNDITCAILFTPCENFIIKYRNYSKIINYNRYTKLIRNYDRPFPYDIIKLVLRYSIFDTSNQHWSIGVNLYDYISEKFNISFEMFASPLNFSMNMYCSLFLDTDRVFGGVGSFYNLTVDKILNQNIRGVFYNPPYLPILMSHTTKICLDILHEMEMKQLDFTIVSFLPNWTDASYIHTFINNKYVVHHKVINKGDYVLHEKDKGKLIKGTFDLIIIVMNSMKTQWDIAREIEVDNHFKDIVKNMKEETYSNNVES